MTHLVSNREYSNGEETVLVTFHEWTGNRRATLVVFAIGDKEYSYQRPTAAKKKLESLGFYYVRTRSKEL